MSDSHTGEKFSADRYKKYQIRILAKSDRMHHVLELLLERPVHFGGSIKME